MLLDSSTLDGKGDILLLDSKQDFDGSDEQQVAVASESQYEEVSDPHGASHAAPAKLQEKEAAPSPDPAATSPDHEVIVDMEILPGSKSSDTNAQEIFAKLKKTLQDPQSL